MRGSGASDGPMRAAPKAIREISGVRPDALPQDILTGTEPVVFKGLVADWPLVQAGSNSAAAARDYLKSFHNGASVAVTLAGPEEGGRVFYNDDLSGPNFEQHMARLDIVLDKMVADIGNPDAPLAYVGSTTIDACLPGMRAENDIDLGARDALASIWIGGKSRIPAHYDLPDNVACVAVGRRRFTLFPPEQLPNLYVGPLDITPAGQSVSVVDITNPDLERFPRFAEAWGLAQVAELEPGDALFIPSMWWHHVESLDAFNVLVNYWWRQSPAHMGPPVNVLFHALMAIRDLPPAQKAVWKGIFDHYVFDQPEGSLDHIPEGSRGVLGPMDERNAQRIRAFLQKRLSR